MEPTGPSRLAQVYQDQAGHWRWRLKVSGRIVADSGQGYTRRPDARTALTRVLTSTNPVTVQEVLPDGTVTSSPL